MSIINILKEVIFEHIELSAPQCLALKEVTSEYLEPLLYLVC